MYIYAKNNILLNTDSHIYARNKHSHKESFTQSHIQLANK